MIKIAFINILFLLTSALFAQDDANDIPVPNPKAERFVWAKRKGARIVIDCFSRGQVIIDSFNMDLNPVKRETSDKACKSFEVIIIDKENRESVLLTDLDLNFLVYMEDRLRRSPSDLMSIGAFGNFSRPVDGSLKPIKKILFISLLDVPTAGAQLALYSLAIVKTRIKSGLLLKRLVRFLEKGIYSKTTRINKRYMRNIPTEMITINDDYEILTR